MEGKTVILSVLILSLVMGQLQVDAKPKICCPSTRARNNYGVCRLAGKSRTTCASISGCQIVEGSTCPNDYLTQELSGRTEYCKLGCVFSMCNVLSSLENSDGSDIVNAAVAQCTNSCSAFCANGFTEALEISSSE